jgi:hypothetical protein
MPTRIATPSLEELRKLDQLALLTLADQKLQQLGTYKAKLTKQERVKGKMLPAQVINLVLREQPLAARLDYVEGPSAGRKVLYNSTLRPTQLRLREAGFFKVVGAIWLDVNSSLTRDDTNHPITELGFRFILNRLRNETEKMKHIEGVKRIDEGLDDQGRWCIRSVAPPGTQGLYAIDSRVCIDLALGLPTRLEVSDDKGPLESYIYTDVQHAPVGDDYFTLEAAGL